MHYKAKQRKLQISAYGFAKQLEVNYLMITVKYEQIRPNKTVNSNVEYLVQGKRRSNANKTGSIWFIKIIFEKILFTFLGIYFIKNN